MNYITEENSMRLASTLPRGNLNERHSLFNSKEIHALCNAAVQHYRDSLPKSEAVAYQQRYIDPNEEASSWKDCDLKEARILSMNPRYEVRSLYLYLRPSSQPALSKDDMVKVLDLLRNTKSIGLDGVATSHHNPRLIKLVDEAITIMQSAIERMK